MSTLVAKRSELDAKRKQLGDIFAEAGADMNMDNVKSIEGDSAHKANEIKQRNDEITALAKEVETLADLEKTRREFDEEKARNGDKGGGGGGGTTIPTGGERGGKEGATKSLGRLFVESKAFTEYGGRRGPLSVVSDMSEKQLSRIFPQSKALLDTGDFESEPQRLPGILEMPFRQIRITDLIPETATSKSTIDYMEETTATNGATMVDEGAEKPESALVFTKRTDPVEKVATLLPVTDEMFEDEPGMEGYVNNRLRLFLQLTKEAQILGGNGTPPNISGITDRGIQTRTHLEADPVPDSIYHSIVDINTGAFLDADGLVMNALDWSRIRLLRTTDGIYIWGSPSEIGPERIWGLNVVKSPIMTEGSALIGAFRTSAQIYRRNEISFDVSDSHADFFAKNKLMIRAEQRFGLAVYRPQGFVLLSGLPVPEEE